MNRIRHLREERGLTAEALAQRVGTTNATISRLETGERQLTEAWMRRIAKALDVRPSDLLALATLADFDDEITPYIPDAAELVVPLASRRLYYYRVTKSAVSRIGVPAGKIVLIDMSKEALAGLKTGDMVYVRVSEVGNARKGHDLLRQFVAPDLLHTNREGLNNSFHADGSEVFEVEIKGLVITSDGT